MTECVDMCVVVFPVSLLYNGSLTTTCSSFTCSSRHVFKTKLNLNSILPAEGH